MNFGPELLLVGAVAVVGVLHTVVPDHWVPITLIARQRGWSKAETARASFQAGAGHVLSTLLIALVVWLAGIAVAERFGHFIDMASSLALIAFGGWIAISASWELHLSGRHGHGHRHGLPHFHGPGEHGHTHGHPHTHEHEHEHEHELEAAHDPLYAPLRGDATVRTRHIHTHKHGRGSPHVHWHDHTPATSHRIATVVEAEPPLHEHRHKMATRTALLLILGSSPMVEGIPAFFAASKYGVRLVAVMSVVLAVSTIATYVLLCVYSTAGLQRINLGAFERYGEVLSGAFIAMVGLAFWLLPVF